VLTFAEVAIIPGVPITELPDTLVLGAGGTLGEAWLRGLLSGIEAASGLDFRGCEYLVGTSAGSIVAAALAGGRRPEAGDRAAREWREAAAPAAESSLRRLGGAAARLGAAAASPLAPVALAGLEPAGRLARAAALAAAPRPHRRLDGLGRQLAALGARFDGRLRIAVVDRRSGRRVLLGAPGAPTASVADAVLASCAVPWLFAPVEIGGREYVDGGVWSPTNLDAAPGGRGARVLCLAPSAGPATPRSAAGALRAVTAAALAAEEMALRGRGMRPRTIVPDAASIAAIGADLMDARPSERVLDAAFAQGQALATG
jgi:NTE family protein